MEKKFFTFVLIIVGVLLAVDILARHKQNPVLENIQAVQQDIVKRQKKLEDKVTKLASQPQSAAVPTDTTKRLNDVEEQIKGLVKLFVETKAKEAGIAQRPQRPQEDLSKVYDIDITHSPILGNKDAPITIVEFVDFQCPFCHKFHPVTEEVLKAYPKDVKVILKNFPLNFHREARSAAKAAFAAAEYGKYWEMVNLLFANNKSLGAEKYKELAKSLGINVSKFEKTLKEKDAEFEQKIKADMDLGRKVNVRGTPTFYLNGKKTRARNLQSFKAEIDAILKEKK